MKGKVKWYNSRKGYGFIEDNDGNDVFMHQSAIPEGTYLNEGDEVEFEVEKDEKGQKVVNLKKL